MASAPPRSIYNFSGPVNFAFAVSALLNILQLKYDGNADSPFDKHPKIMGIAIICFLVYCLACDAELRLSSISPNYANVFHHVVSSLGYFSLASLASVLVSPISIRPIVYLVLALFSVWLLNWVQNGIFVGRGYTYNSPSRRRVDVPLIHASVDTDRLPV